MNVGINNFHEKMQIKLSAVPTQTGAYTDPQEISNCFKQVFSECRLDSYTQIKSVTELFKKMSDVDNDISLLNKAFNVLDVKSL